MKEEELDLLHRYLDGGSSPDDLTRLEELLRDNAEARSTLRSLATIDAKWQALGAKEWGARRDSNRILEVPSFRARMSWLALGAVAAALVVGLFVWISGPSWNEVQGIARVIRVGGEAMVDGKQVLAGGDELFATGTVSMTSGSIELAYRDSGVHVVAGAPLSMRLENPMRLFLQEGEVKLVVPPQGIGFVVNTVDQEIVDLGTSFILKAKPEGSEVLVLDGQITVGRKPSDTKRVMMSEGEFAIFNSDGSIKKRVPEVIRAQVTEAPLRVTEPGPASLHGKIMGQVRQPVYGMIGDLGDVIGEQMLPLIRSGFQDQSSLTTLKTGEPLRFAGIAGGFPTLPARTGLELDTTESGWMAWYSGRVVPPRKGRYRFWGYADNHLLVAIDGKPVFEGSRNDSLFTTIGAPRMNNPALPCLIARAGFANGPWLDSDGGSVQLDILFGEIGRALTSGLLLIEWEGETYEETFWGQPRWPVFMTEAPDATELAGLESLRLQLESEIMGSFSVAVDSVWAVEETQVASR